jgi:hypothetical protein
MLSSSIASDLSAGSRPLRRREGRGDHDAHGHAFAAVGAAVGISALIALDGESNWLEGALLVIVYLILAGSFFELV